MAPDAPLASQPTQPHGDGAGAAVARLLSSGTAFLVVILLTTAIAIALGALSENRRLFDNDEAIYMRVIELFGGGLSLELLQSYEGEPASPGPLFFMIYAACGNVFGFSYPVFRGLSLAMTLLTMLCLWVFLRKQPLHDGRVFFPLLAFLFPYIFCMGFTVMAEPLTLLFTVLGVCCYHHGLARKSNAALLLGSIAITAALYVRIHAVFAPAALMSVLLLQRDRSVRPWCLAVAPILARLPLVFLQGGLTVSREAFAHTKPELAFCPSNINFFFVWFGYMFFPLLWWCSGRRWVNLAATLALIPFYILVSPNFLGTEHNGALRTLFVRLELNAATAQCVLFPAWLIGCYMTIALIQRIVSGKDLRDVFFGSCIVMFMASLVFSTVAFERYYQLAVPTVVLMGVAGTRRLSAYAAMASCHVFFLVLSAARIAADLP